jgi:hypothetical protein
MSAGQKPWKTSAYLGDYWWYYAEKTPFYEDIMALNRVSIRKINLRFAYYFTTVFGWIYRNIPFKGFVRNLFKRVTGLSLLLTLRGLPMLKYMMSNRYFPFEYIYLFRNTLVAAPPIKPKSRALEKNQK